MQIDPNSLTALTKIINKIIEVSDPISNELRSLKNEIDKTSLQNFEDRIDPIHTNIKVAFDKCKQLKRSFCKIMKKDQKNHIVSKTSLKIKKTNEKTHNNKQLKDYCTQNLLPLQLKGPDQTMKQISSESVKNNPLSLSKGISKESKQSNIPLNMTIKCYVCKKNTQIIHFFYDQMCSDCGLFNYQKRSQKCDLTGIHVLLTGVRIKIGYQLALILLRNGCNLIATTRFPKDALLRFTNEKDFPIWKDRLKIYGLDFRNLTELRNFCQEMQQTLPKLDILINNAAQTNRHHPLFYKNLVDIENSEINKDLQRILNEKYLCAYPEMKMLALENPPGPDEIQSGDPNIHIENPNKVLAQTFNPMLNLYFPDNCLDVNQQQIDLLPQNSWVKNFSQVSFMEFAETQVINSWAPYLLCLYLKPLFIRNPSDNKHIINVSSMEGRFNKFKRSCHPHTNMAKASLDMLTRTCGQDFVKDHIYMNSVDTGWVSEMYPLEHTIKRTVPLDEIDGAMRVLDPIFNAFNHNQKVHSMFYKDYKGIPLIDIDKQ